MYGATSLENELQRIEDGTPWTSETYRAGSL
jgi:hypothetical protein